MKSIKDWSESELRVLESQLRCPTGEVGLEVAKTMHETNISMTLSAIALLDLKANARVLEIGHGSCAHLEELLASAENIRYMGLEISETMQQLAENNNSSKNQVVFKLYDGEKIPFEAASFDCVLSVNTIYFWSQPDAFIKEIERVLHPMGRCVLAFSNKDFMKTLPFVGTKFDLYDKGDIEKLLASTNMQIAEIIEKTEDVLSKTDVPVKRTYTLVCLKKRD